MLILKPEEATSLRDDELENLEARLEAALDQIRREHKRRLVSEKSRLRASLDQNTCAVCLEAPKCIMFDPCNHICACEGCGAKVSKCPLCQIDVRSRVKVYL